ncbi:MAG: SPOR domain-containing protein [Sphingobium sp.]
MKRAATALAAIFGGALAFGPVVAANTPPSDSARQSSPKNDAGSKAGVDAWMQGDYAKAVAIWLPLAATGDADAQYDLGQAYRLGKGVPVDFPVALEYYRKAAGQGHPRAQESYGLLLFAMNRRAEAMPYLQKSAERGEPNAQYIVGTALYNGDLAPRDLVRAYALMSSAARKGMPAATSSLAAMDQSIPEATRNRGLELATQMEQSRQAQVAVVRQVPPPAKLATTTIPAAALSAAAKAVEEEAARLKAAAHTPTPKAETKAAPTSPATKTPPPTPTPKAEVAQVASAKAGSWRVQLGAFSTDERANSAWVALSKKVKELSGYKPILVKGGNVIRLQAGPLATQTDAQKLCSSVKASGADCILKAM